MTAHLFSIYTLGPYLRVLGFIIIGLGTIPDWYQAVPSPGLFRYISCFLPPLGNNIILMMEGELTFSHYIYQAFTVC